MNSKINSPGQATNKNSKFWKSTITIISDLNSNNCPSQETEVTSTPIRPVDNVFITTKGLQDRNNNYWMEDGGK